MPEYIYKHPEKEEYVEIFQRMNDKHVFVCNEGLQWKRVFTVPRVAVDIRPVDPFSKKDFLKATKKNGTVGDMMDLSAELGEKRAELEGEDPVRRNYFNKYKKKIGKKHLADKTERVDKKHFSIDFTKGDSKDIEVVEK